MAKRPDKNDATMEVSESQLVPGAPRVPPRRPVNPNNDMSMWAGAVVGGDQFTPAPIPPKSGGGGGGRWILAIVGVLALAGGGYALYRFVLAGDPAPKPAPVVDPIDAMPLIADAPAIVIDAAIPDAVAIDAALPDAAVAAVPTIAPKKPPVKKKVVKKKKKPVKKPVRRRR